MAWAIAVALIAAPAWGQSRWPADRVDFDDGESVQQKLDAGSLGGGHGDGANCPAGQYPLGVDAAGNVQGCTTDQVGAGGGATNLGTLVDPVLDELTVTSDTGSNAVLPPATPTTPGVMANEDKAKLDGIEAGAQLTDLTVTRDATSVTVNSSDGTEEAIPAATSSLAGVMTAEDRVKVDGIAPGADVSPMVDGGTFVVSPPGNGLIISGDADQLCETGEFCVSTAGDITATSVAVRQHPTNGGSILTQEGLDDGANQFGFKIPDSGGLSTDGIWTVNADGTIPVEAVESPVFASGFIASWDAPNVPTGTCVTNETVAAVTGLLASDIIEWEPRGSIVGISGWGTTAVRLDIYSDADAIKADLCNPSGADINPAPIPINWKVTR